jgi:hypothetical protein
MKEATLRTSSSKFVEHFVALKNRRNWKGLVMNIVLEVNSEHACLGEQKTRVNDF